MRHHLIFLAALAAFCLSCGRSVPVVEEGISLPLAGYRSRMISDLRYELEFRIPETLGIRALFPYIEQQLSQGATLHHITRHTLGLFNGLPGARQFRRHLSEQATRKGAGIEVLEQALSRLTEPA